MRVMSQVDKEEHREEDARLVAFLPSHGGGDIRRVAFSQGVNAPAHSHAGYIHVRSHAHKCCVSAPSFLINSMPYDFFI